jgi:hypothetical protein
LREETRSDDRVTQLSARLNVVSENGVTAENGAADLNCRDSSGNVIAKLFAE